MGRGIFVTGTDTGVGKTVIAGGLAALFKHRGLNIGVMKPVESGCLREGGCLVPQDATFLREMAESEDALSLINPYALEHALAPALAAEIERVKIRIEVIKEAYEILTSRHDILIVEGAGGLLVPLSEDYFMVDLARELDLSLLLVSRASLGTINHTLLTLHYVGGQGLSILGLVINHTSRLKGLTESLNLTALRRWGGAPFMGAMPFLSTLNKEAIRKAIEANLDLKPLEAMFGE